MNSMKIEDYFLSNLLLKNNIIYRLPIDFLLFQLIPLIPITC